MAEVSGGGARGRPAKKKKKKSRPPDLINMDVSDRARGNVRGATGDTRVKQAATLFGASALTPAWPARLVHVGPAAESRGERGRRRGGGG